MRTPLVLVVMQIAGAIFAQPVTTSCNEPLCVNRTDDQAGDPQPGTLRHAVRVAPPGATIRFDPSLKGQTIRLDPSSLQNQIRITRDLVIEGPGAPLLTISGDRRTRIFSIEGGAVRIAGLTLADGVSKGGDGAPGTGRAGGGGGAAGLGGAILLLNGSLVLDRIVLSGNQAIGGYGGAGGTGFGMGSGGAGGAPFTDEAAAHGGTGGTSDPSEIAGGQGPWGGGGGGGGSSLDAGAGIGGPGGAGGFGGGTGGAGGFVDSDGNSTGGGAGSGGSGLGGAVFVRSGLLQLIDTEFVGNSAIGGTGGKGASSGMGKGGALFVCSPNLCGAGFEAVAIWSGKTSFTRNTATDAGGEQSLPGRDDSDVCGYLSSPVATRLSVLAPSEITPREPFPVTVSALDANGNMVQSYTGVVHLTSSDPAALLPPDVALANGFATLSATMNSTGMQTVTAMVTEARTVKGTSNPIAVKPAGW